MITDYTSLKATVVAYMKRQDLDAEVETFIQLVELKLDNMPNFRTREMSHSTTYISKDGLVPFYDDYLSLRSIRNTGGNALTLASPAVMAESKDCSTCPRFYREEGRQLHISPVVDYVSLDITYFQKIPALSDINTTNWLLQRAPQVYLYGALIESTNLVMNDERFTFWKNQYDQAVQHLIDTDIGDRLTGALTSVQLYEGSTSCITDEASYVEPGELPGAPEFIALIPDQISDLNILYTHDTSQYFSGEVTGYALYDAPTWLTMDADTGVMSGVPNAEALLTGLTVSASNEYGTVISNTFGMRVLAEPTGPPRFDIVKGDGCIFDLHCNVDISQQISMSPFFLDGGAVGAYSLNNAPSWMAIDSVTGLISGTPLATEAVTDVTVTATNTKGSDTSSAFNVQTLDEVAVHKYWRFTSYGCGVARDLGDFDFRLMDTIGGNTVCTGGTQMASSTKSSTAIWAAFDGNLGTAWVVGQGNSNIDWIGYNFASPVAIKEGLHTDYLGWTVDGAWQYSDDNVTFTTIKSARGDWPTQVRIYSAFIGEV